MPRDSVIASRSNAWFKRFRVAIEHHREEITVEGPKHVGDCLAAGWSPIAIAVRADVPFSGPPSARIIPMADALFRSLSDTVQSQGVLALFERPTVTTGELLRREGLFVVLDGIQDPGNVGTIVRLAVAFGAAGLLTTEGTADPFSSKAIRASAGAALSVPIAQSSRGEFLALTASNEMPILAAAAGGKRLPASLPSRLALVLGSEGQGVSPEIASVAGTVGIEMTGPVESLNVGSAAAILLWQIQAARQGAIRS